MKRLLCLVSAMNAGGAETFLMKIFRKLDKEKYVLDFCVNIEEPGYYDEEIFQLGGKIFYVPPKTKNLVLFRKSLLRIVKNNSYDHVLRITSNGIGFWDLAIAKKGGAKVCIARSSNSSDGKDYWMKAANLLGRLFWGRCVDVKIAPSDLAAKYTFGKRDYKKGDVFILNNALDLNVYRFSYDYRSIIRREFGLKDSDILLGHVGRFSRQKNHVFLLNVFSELCLKSESYKLILLGEGELKNDCRKIVERLGISDKVVFAGIRTDIPAILSAMDIFVFPSLYEGMPNTVIEAQANGLSCVVSNCITSQVKITDLVKMLPINSTNLWISEILTLTSECRKNHREYYSNKLKETKYNIDNVVNSFTELIWGKEKEDN